MMNCSISNYLEIFDFDNIDNKFINQIQILRGYHHMLVPHGGRLSISDLEDSLATLTQKKLLVADNLEIA